MDKSNIGGGNDSVSDLNVSRNPKPDISVALRQVRASLLDWKRLLAQGKVESLVVKLDSPPERNMAAVRMLTESEQQQLRETKAQLHQYQQRIIPTPIID